MFVAISATLLVVPSVEAKQRNNNCYHDSLLTAYSANWHAVKKQFGKRAPGRNIRKWGITDRRGANCKHIRKSLNTLRRMQYSGNHLLNPSRPYVPPAQTATLRATGAPLTSIAACESGGNYSTNTGNGFYGAYQFDLQTWQSVGGSGNPANASPAEQDMRASMLYAQRGSSPWPVCGR